MQIRAKEKLDDEQARLPHLRVSQHICQARRADSLPPVWGRQPEAAFTRLHRGHFVLIADPGVRRINDRSFPHMQRHSCRDRCTAVCAVTVLLPHCAAVYAHSMTEWRMA